MPQEPAPQMSFLCFGVGAIGAYIGGSLAAKGHHIVFVERPEVADQVRRQGIIISNRDNILKVESPLMVATVAEALRNGPFDAAILAVKSFDTPVVLEMLRPYTSNLPPIVSFQNGVENEPLLARIMGTNRVIPGTVTTAVGRNGPGDVVVERLRGIGIAVNNPTGARLKTVLDQAGLRARGYTNPAAMKWSKMLTNLIANASSAILNMTPEAIFNHPGLYQIEVRQMLETLQVMQAMNIPVVDLPATPVRLLAWVVTNLPRSLSQILVKQSVGKGRGAKMPSFHIDLYSGRGKSEVDYLNGAVARAGKQQHILTPVNQTLNEILMKMARDEIRREEYAGQADKLIAAIPSK